MAPPAARGAGLCTAGLARLQSASVVTRGKRLSTSNQKCQFLEQQVFGSNKKGGQGDRLFVFVKLPTNSFILTPEKKLEILARIDTTVASFRCNLRPIWGVFGSPTEDSEQFPQRTYFSSIFR